MGWAWRDFRVKVTESYKLKGRMQDQSLNSVDVPLYLTSALLNKQAGIEHGFFGARGGVSTGLYESLNCGALSLDKPKNVAQNRMRVAACFSLQPQQLISAQQCHSTDVLLIESIEQLQQPFVGDGFVTKLPNVGISALGADCAPVLFYEPENKVIGAAHSGWKGAVDGINEAVIDTMCQAGAVRNNIVAAIGPAMQQAYYEVQEDFKAAILQRATVEVNLQSCFYQRDSKLFFDVPAYIGLRLAAAGVGQFDCLEQDTYSQPQEYFSYRRACAQNQTDYGRQIAVICLTNLTE